MLQIIFIEFVKVCMYSKIILNTCDERSDNFLY